MLIAYLEQHGNDLTAAAIACVPVIGDVLDSLGAVAGRAARAHVRLRLDLLCSFRIDGRRTSRRAIGWCKPGRTGGLPRQHSELVHVQA